jgi:hypothetical protein
MLTFLFSPLGRWLGLAAALAAALLGARLWLAAHDATLRTEEKAACDARIETMVSAAERDALAARLAEAERLRQVADDAADAERERAAGLARTADEREVARKARAAEAAAQPGLTYPSAEDLQWLDRASR